jgi:hypothetical protein
MGKELASQSVKDAYGALKGAIAARFKRKGAIEAVEEAPDSESARNALSDALEKTGAQSDSDILKLAEALTVALRQAGPDKLQKANITIAEIDGYRDAIVRSVVASGDININRVSSRRGTAIVENVQAGTQQPKN